MTDEAKRLEDIAFHAENYQQMPSEHAKYLLARLRERDERLAAVSKESIARYTSYLSACEERDEARAQLAEVTKQRDSLAVVEELAIVIADRNIKALAQARRALEEMSAKFRRREADWRNLETPHKGGAAGLAYRTAYDEAAREAEAALAALSGEPKREETHECVCGHDGCPMNTPARGEGEE